MIFFLHLEPVNVNDNNYKVNIAWNLVEIRNMTRLNLNFNYICGFTKFSTQKNIENVLGIINFILESL